MSQIFYGTRTANQISWEKLIFGSLFDFRFAIDSELIHTILHRNRVAGTDGEIEEGINKKQELI